MAFSCNEYIYFATLTLEYTVTLPEYSVNNSAARLNKIVVFLVHFAGKVG